MIGMNSKSGKYDYIIAGLGNPGLRYSGTRHNAGFDAVDLLAEKHGCEITKKFKNALTADAKLGNSRCLLIKPQTFMNLSGEAIVPIAKFYKIPPQNTIIIFDDVEFDVGKIRIRRNGSHGGHNGMRNIIELSGSTEFPRIKIGVGKKPRPDYDLADWVLGKISMTLADDFTDALERASCAAEEIVTAGIDSAMNKYNR